MTLFAVRRNVGGAPDDLARMLRAGETDECQAIAGYWTRDDGEFLALFATDADAAPQAGPGARVLAVAPITPEEYGPPAMESNAANAEDLQLVLVRRQLDPLTQSEFKAIALQAIMCAYEYSDMRWLRSYWARETDQLFCLFETKSHDLVREHAMRSRIPCDEIHDAVEILPA